MYVQNHRPYSQELGVLVYLLGALTCAYSLFTTYQLREKAGKMENLPLALSLESVSDPRSHRGPAWAVWGPLELPGDRRVRVEISATGIDDIGLTWLSGQASLVPAENLEDSSGLLLTADGVKSLFNKAEQLLEDGRKAKILESYGFPFEFWRYGDCSGLFSHKFFDNVYAGGKVPGTVFPDKKGRYYVILEYVSSEKRFGQDKISVRAAAVKRPVWQYWVGFVFLLALSFIKASSAERLPESVREAASLFRRLLGMALYGMGPLALIVVINFFAGEADNDCVHFGIGSAIVLTSMFLLIPGSMFLAWRLHKGAYARL